MPFPKNPIFYFDFETSGLDPFRHGIIQAAWIVENDGEIVEERTYDVALEPNTDICLEAIDVNSFTLERIKAGKSLSYVLEAMKQSILPFNGIRPAGHNVQFDISFLMEAQKKIRNDISGYLKMKKAIDTVSILRFMDYKGLISLDNYKLTTVCQYLGISLNAHDALEDIRATRLVFLFLKGL